MHASLGELRAALAAGSDAAAGAAAGDAAASTLPPEALLAHLEAWASAGSSSTRCPDAQLLALADALDSGGVALERLFQPLLQLARRTQQLSAVLQQAQGEQQPAAADAAAPGSRDSGAADGAPAGTASSRQDELRQTLFWACQLTQSAHKVRSKRVRKESG